jgi:DNA repair exonuclease SbcCD ATPase subunit
MDYPQPVEGFDLMSAEASNEQIQELVGMSFSIFTNTIIFAQNTRGKSVTDFLDEDDAGQKEIFATLFHLDSYEQARDLVIPNLKAGKVDLENTEKQISDTGIGVINEQSQIKELSASKITFEESKLRKIKEQEDKIKELRIALDKANPEKKTKDFLDQKLMLEGEEKALSNLKKEEKQSQEALTKGKTTLGHIEDSLQRLLKPINLPLIPKPEKPNVDPEAVTKGKLEEEENLRQLKEFKTQKEEQKKSYNESLRLAKRDRDVRITNLATAKRDQVVIDVRKKSLIEKIEGITTCPACKQDFLTDQAKESALADLHEQLLSYKDLDLSSFEEWVVSMEKKVAEIEATRFDETEYKEIVEAIFKTEVRIGSSEECLERVKVFEKDSLVYQTQLKQIDQAEKVQKESIVELGEEKEKLVKGIFVLQETYQKAFEALKVKELYVDHLKVNYGILHASLEAEIMPLQKQYNEACIALKQAQEGVFGNGAWLGRSEGNLKLLLENAANLKQALVLLKDQLKILEDLNEAFSKEGIVSELFREYLPDIESLAQAYLTELTNNELEITFSPQRELKKKVKGVAEVRNEFEIKVQKKLGGGDYDLISGSEQNKAALVVKWALSDLAYQHSNVSCNFRSYDEIFDGLDEKSSQRLGNLLLEKFQEDGRLTFVVTHKVELDDSFPYKIILRKEQGVSQIQEIVE